VGYLAGGMNGWFTSGLPTGSVSQISVEELHEMILGEENFTLVDVRAKAEFEENHIKGAINIETANLRTDYQQLDPNQATILVCSSGNRSSLGTSILAQRGFKQLFNVAGGMTGYSAAGYTRECRVCANPHGSRFFSEIFEN